MTRRPAAQRRFAVASIAACALMFQQLAGAGAEADVGSGPYPPATSLSVAPMPSVHRPGYLSPVVDPAFGTTITRVSDQAAFGTGDLYLRHTYSKNQPWNSDGSRILLSYTPTGYLLDGSSYRLIRTIALGRDSQALWSNTQPDVIYNRRGNQFLKLDAGTGARTVLRTFADFDSISIGEGEGNLSADDRYVALVARRGGSTWVISYDIASDQIIGQQDFGTAGMDWASFSQSGNHVVVHWFAHGPNQGRGVDLYDRNLNFVRHLYDYSEHGDLGVDANGVEVYVQVDYDERSAQNKQAVVAIPLDGSPRRVLIETNWVGTHVSCRNLLRPGWCYVSDDAANRPTSAGYNETYALALDGSGSVERFAHQHQSEGIDYSWRAMSSPDRTGTKVMFSSDWGWGTGSAVNAYVAEVTASG